MRQGQVTLFAIIGLVALLAAGVFFYLRAAPQEPETLIAQQESAAVSGLVQQCLAQAAEDALRRAALQGGYLDPVQAGAQAGVEGALLRIGPQQVPLWHEVHACAQGEAGCVGDNRPQLCTGRDCPSRIAGGVRDVSFQRSIELGTDEGIRSCLSNFSALPHVVVEERGEPRTSALIRDRDVLLELEYPLRITTSDEQRVDLSEFSSSLDVDLPRLYELANLIYQYQREHAFIEEQFLHLIGIYGSIDSPIPPIEEAQLHGGPKFWVTRNVQRTIDQDMLPFLSFIQVVNAQGGYAPIESPFVDPAYQGYATGAYDYMALRMGDADYPLDVQFQYPSSTLRLDINGKQFLKGKELPGTDFLSVVGGLTFIEYKFSYSASFPLVVKVSDPAAFNGDGLDLYFGLEANVRNNHALNTSAQVATVTAADATLDLSSPMQLVDHEHTVRVTDRHTGAPVADAGIAYACGAEYQLGVTGEDGTWKGKLPYCLAGGHLLAEHVDYATTGIALDSTEDDQGSSEAQLSLWRRVDKRIIVYKRAAPEAAGTPAPGRTALGANETVIVTLMRHAQTPYDSPVPLAGVMEFGDTNTLSEKNATLSILEIARNDSRLTQADYNTLVADTMARERERVDVQVADLVPGQYDLTGFLTYYGLIEIPSERKCKDILGGLKEECVTLPAQNFTAWTSGGVVLTEEDAITLSEEFVYSNETLVLYVLEQPIPQSWSQLQQYQDIETYQSYGRKPLVQPDFGE